MRRRDFLRNTAAATATGFAIPYLTTNKLFAEAGKASPNDRLRVGFIGAGGRARHLMHAENLADHADIVAVADCYLARIEESAKVVPGSERWKKYQHYQDMLAKEKLDVVYIPTTTHARALICIHAMQAGLDVYAEKPLTLTIQEGQVLVRAARKLNRVLQVGTQQRSIPSNAYASKLVREGAIGKIREVITCNYEPGRDWPVKPAQPVPEGMDWDQWCNQTELRPYHEELRSQWGLWWPYDGGGQSWGVSGWGTHSLDQVQCALGTDYTGPVEIWPEETGEQARVTMRYENGVLLKQWGAKRDLADLGAIFNGDQGSIEILRGSFLTDRPELKKDGPTTLPANVPGEAVWHFNDFFDCVRSRKRPAADVEIAHRSNTLCHLTNICRDLGRKLKWDPKAEQFIGDDEANKLISRPRRAGYEFPKEFI